MKKKLSVWILLSLLIFSPKIVQAMHIMEGFLPLKWAILWSLLALPFFVIGLWRMGKDLKKGQDQKMILGLVGGFAFVLSALKIPSVTGSCSHPTGVGLGAILFGPSIMAVLGTMVLLFQALLLAHGGLTTLGANAFSMAVVGPLVSYIIYRILGRDRKNKNIAVFLAATLGDLATYVITSIQLSLAFPDAVGGIKMSLAKFLSVFALTQIPLAIVEGIITVMVFNMLQEYQREGVLKFEKNI